MFDDPGKKLRRLEQELKEADDVEPVTWDQPQDTEELDDADVVYAPPGRRPGLRTLVFLLVMLVLILAAGRWMGWL